MFKYTINRILLIIGQIILSTCFIACTDRILSFCLII